MPPAIHVIASLMVDRILSVPSLPRPGETVAARGVRTLPGGKGANQAAAAARCGVPVRACGRTGAEGRFIVDAMRAAGVDTGAVRTDDPVAGSAVVLVADDGQNAIVIAPESNRRIAAADIDAFLADATRGDILLLQNECSQRAHALAAAARLGLRAWLNAAPADPALRSADLGSLDGLVVNETEAEELTGLADPAAALDALADRLPRATVVVTLGAAGARLRHAGALHVHAGFRVRAIDTVGCGDAFVGAFLAAIVRGHAPVEALAWGNAAGALASRREGAMPSLPPGDEVRALAAQPAGSVVA